VVSDDPRRFEDTLGNGEYIHAPLPKGKVERVYSAEAYEALRSERDRLQAEIERLRAELDKRFDHQAVSNIVGSVQDVLTSAIRIREIQDIQAELIAKAHMDRDRWKNVAELAMQARFDDVWSHVEEAHEWAVRGE
jgi:hypothetical protein